MAEGDQDFVKPVPDISKAGFNLNAIDSQGNQSPLETFGIKAHHTKMGVDVSYGQGPDNYDQWVIREPNGGGSVIVPYLWIEGELYVGANGQNRSLTGGLVTEVPRGFSLPNESHEETARREFQEETGVVDSLAQRVKPLAGKPINPNSAYFQANPRKGEGVKLFGVQIKQDEVELRRNSEDPRRRIYKFTPEVQGEIKELNEKIKPEGIRFFHASLLSGTSDGFTLQAIGRLASQKTS